MSASKSCCRCGELKLLTEFYRNSSRKDGYGDYCKPCWRDYMAPRDKERHRKNPRRSSYQRRGMSRGQFEALLLAQGGLCWFCHGNRAKVALCLDHNHATGEVRRFLCRPCNVGLEFFREGPERIRRAIRYLMLPDWETRCRELLERLCTG